jgi:hypothetical protein
LLAGFTEKRLLDEEHESVRSHLSQCTGCATLVDLLAAEAAPIAAHTTPQRSGEIAGASPRASWLFLKAAGLLLVAGLTAAGILAFRTPRSSEEELARWAAVIGFPPLSRAERAGGEAVLRGIGEDVTVFPSQTILETRPNFHWRAVEGVTEYEVTLHTADLQPRWSRRTAAPPLAFPAGEAPLEPGSHWNWSVAFEGPLGRQRSPENGKSFRVVSTEVAKEFAAKRAAVLDQVPAPLQSLVLAHLAAHLKLYREAASAAVAYWHERPGDRVGRETLEHVKRRLLGASAASGEWTLETWIGTLSEE